MKGQRYANLTAVSRHPRRRRSPSAAASTPAPSSRSFGIPQFFGIYSDYLSGVHVLVGLGIVMVIGGLLSFKWPSVGGIIVCVAAMIGLIYTYNRGQYRWTPYLYYWWGPWLFAWICRHLRGLRGLQERAAEQREARRRAARGGLRAADAHALQRGADCSARGSPRRRPRALSSQLVRPPAGSSPARR